jgi:tetratricopeptide (TPR) repeat protein
MTTNRFMTALMMTALLSMAAAAGAQPQQAPPPPPPKPAPGPQPAPKPDPFTVYVPDLQWLQDPAWRSSLEKLKIDAPRLDIQTFDFSAANDAMDKARWVLDDMQWQYQDKEGFRLATPGMRQGGDYSMGKNLLNQQKYDEAIGHFDRVIAQKDANTEGAFYWKAYAQFKLGKSDDALSTIAALRKDHPQSRYLTDAKVLEADAKRRSGQPVNPADMGDDALKVLAINGMKNTDPERAIPLLEGVLAATNGLAVKKQALYVLASMSNQPKAHQILLNYAKGAGNPDLQIEAIRYIAANSDKQATAAELMQIYQSTQDTDVKLAVIGALRLSGNRSSLVNIAGSNGSPTIIRSSALTGLAGTLGAPELYSLYEKETSKELRLQIVSIFGSMNATEQLGRVIKTEKDQDVVRRAIRALGQQEASKTGQLLTDLYGTEQDKQTRTSVISALASQNNAEGLVAIARKEANLDLKMDILRHLADMAPKSKVAADYLAEIIKKDTN